VVNGNLTLGGTLYLTPLADFAVGSYVLFTYTGTLAQNGGGLVIGSLAPNGGAYALNIIAPAGATPGQVQLVYGPVQTTPTWIGGGDAVHWSSTGNWSPSVVPASGATTALIFPDVGASAYQAANNLTGTFVLNRLDLATTAAGSAIGGNPLQFDGLSPALLQNSSGAFALTSNVVLAASLQVGGDGTGWSCATSPRDCGPVSSPALSRCC
jgi:fibronectin-binding autotransporter adhesin